MLLSVFLLIYGLGAVVVAGKKGFVPTYQQQFPTQYFVQPKLYAPPYVPVYSSYGYNARPRQYIYSNVYNGRYGYAAGYPMKTASARLYAHKKKSDGTADILGDLKDLEADVKGFSDAMKGMTEALIIDHGDGSFDMQEELKGVDNKQEKQKLKSKKNGSQNKGKDTIKTKNGSQKRIAKAFLKTAKRKKKLEDQMVGIFTNYICGSDC